MIHKLPSGKYQADFYAPKRTRTTKDKEGLVFPRGHTFKNRREAALYEEKKINLFRNSPVNKGEAYRSLDEALAFFVLRLKFTRYPTV